MDRMPGWLGTNVYCILVLCYINISVKKAQMHMPEEGKAFHNLTVYLIASLVADSFSRLYAYEQFGFLYPVIVFATYFKYVTLTLMIPLFYKFFLIHLKGEPHKYFKWALNLLWVIQGIITVIVLSSFWTKWALYFDENHIYHRGSLYKYSSYLMLFMGLFVECIIIINKDKLPKKKFKIFAIFLLFPLLGGFIQSLYYGLALGYMGASFSLLIVYVEIVSRVMNKDYLTGLNNRKTFDYYLGEYIVDNGKHPVSAIMIDINYFKEINDRLGHAYGDHALENLGQILQNSVRGDDLVCRIGGDEFAILLKNCSSSVLEGVVNRIYENVSQFNSVSGEPYIIDVSIGSSVYNRIQNIGASDFLKQIDKYMYADKKKRKENMERSDVVRK